MSSPTAVTDRFARTLAASLWLALPLALLATACVSTGLRAGQLAEQSQDYDRAVVEYTKVLKEHPTTARHGSPRPGQAARRARPLQPRAALRKRRPPRRSPRGAADCSEAEPGWGDVEEALTSVRSQLRTKGAVHPRGQDAARDAHRAVARFCPARHRPPPPTQGYRPRSRSAPTRALATSSPRSGRFSNVNVVFDSTYRDQPVTIDLRNSTLDRGAAAVAASTRQLLPRHRAAHHHQSSPTRRPSAASTRKRSCARSS
jgi:hypothetical protein